MPRSTRLLIAACAGLALAGCAEKKGVTIPQVVHVQDTRYVVPAELLVHCPVAMPTKPDVAEAVRVANARRVSLETCNKIKDKYQAFRADD